MTAPPNYGHFARRMDDFARLLSLDALRRFVAVAECGGFRQASRQLHLSQPSLSRSIGELERRVGSRLFVRGARGVELTPVGRVLLKHAQILYADMRQAAAEISVTHVDGQSEIIVAINSSLAATFMPKALTAFSALAPSVHVNVVETRVDHLISGVADCEFDIGLAPTAWQTLAPGLHAEFLGEFPYVVLARSDHPLVQLENVEIEQLWAHTWVLPEPGTVPAQRMDALFLGTAKAYPPPCLYRTTSSTLSKALAIETGHLIAAPLMTANQDLSDGRLKRIHVRDLDLNHDVAIIRREVGFISPNIRLFMSKLRETARDLLP